MTESVTPEATIITTETADVPDQPEVDDGPLEKKFPFTGQTFYQARDPKGSTGMYITIGLMLPVALLVWILS